MKKDGRQMTILSHLYKGVFDVVTALWKEITVSTTFYTKAEIKAAIEKRKRRRKAQ